MRQSCNEKEEKRNNWKNRTNQFKKNNLKTLKEKENYKSRGLMVKTLDSGIVINEFDLQSRYYVPFRTNTLGKSI